MTQDELKSILHYDPLTGLFTWLVSNGPRSKNGTRAGFYHNQSGYRRIKLNGKEYQEHRLVWLYVHGFMPPDMVDHRDRNRSNNRLDNLRLASRIENSQNVGKSKNNTSGFLGVSWKKSNRKWVAQIMYNGKKTHLGLFDTAEEAHDAYQKASSELHPFKT
jgi:hypothetical protein